MLKTVQKWETNCELDTAICEFKLKPLAKVCELVKKLVSSPVHVVRTTVINISSSLQVEMFPEAFPTSLKRNAMDELIVQIDTFPM